MKLNNSGPPTWTPSCCPLGHWHMSKLVNLKKYIPNIQPLLWKPADISFPWMMTASMVSHFLLQIYIIKSYNFHPTSAFKYQFHTLSHSTIFLTACRRSKECLSIPAGTQENLRLIPFVPLISIRLPLCSLDYIVCFRVSTSLKNTTPLFLAKSPLRSANCPSLPSF